MADKNDMVITARLDAEPAIKEAKQAGPKIAKALDVKSEDKGIKAMQVELQKATKNANTFYEALKKGVHATREYKEAVAKRDSRANDLLNAKKQLKEYQDQRADYQRKLKAQEAKYSGLDSEANAKRIAETKSKIAGLTSAIALQEKEVDKLQASYNGLVGVTAKMEKAGKAVTFSSGTKENKENFESYIASEQRAVELADQINQRYAELSSSTQDAAANVEGLSNATAETAGSTDGLKDELEGVSTAAQEAKTGVEELKDTPAEVTVDTSEVSEAKQELDALKDEGTTTQVNLDADTAKMSIAELTRYMQQLRAEQKAIEKAGIPPELEERYNRLIPKIRETQQAMRGYQTSMSGTRSATSKAATAVNYLNSVFKSSGTKVSSVAKAIKNSINNIRHSMNNMSKDFKSRFRTGLRMLTKYVFGFRSLFFLVRRLRSGVKEGIENLVQYRSGSNATNKAISDLRTSLLYLKNAWAAAFAPVINAVMPILKTLIDGLAAVGNAVGRFIAALTGQKTVLQAVKVNAGDYAKSLQKSGSNASKAAKKQKQLNDRLADFDDLNVLGKDKDTDPTGTGGGGGGGAGNTTLDPNKMFKNIKTPMSKLATMIQEAWENKDFTEVGKYLGKKLGVALDKAYIWLRTEGRKKAKEIATCIGTFIDGFLDPNNQLGKRLGRTLAAALQVALDFLVTLITPKRMMRIGEEFATAINTAAPMIIPEIGKALGKIGNAVVSGIWKFVKTIKWDELGKAIGTGINNFFAEMSKVDENGLSGWAKLGQTMSTLITGLLDMILTAIDTINWDEVIQALGEVFANMDIDKIKDQLKTLAGKIWEGIKTAWGLLNTDSSGNSGLDFGKLIGKILLVVAAIKVVLKVAKPVVTFISTLTKLIGGSGGGAAAGGGAAGGGLIGVFSQLAVIVAAFIGTFELFKNTYSGWGDFGNVIYDTFAKPFVRLKEEGFFGMADEWGKGWLGAIGEISEKVLGFDINIDYKEGASKAATLKKLEERYQIAAKALEEFTDAEGNALEGHEEDVKKAKTLMDDVVSEYKKFNGEISKEDRIKEAMKPLLETWKKTTKIIEENTDASGNALEGQEETVERARTLLKAIEPKMESLREQYKECVGDVGDASEGAIDGLADTTKTATETVDTTLSTMETSVETTATNISTTVNGMGTDMEGAFDGVATAANTEFGTVTTDATDFSTDLGDIFGDIEDDMSGAFDTDISTEFATTKDEVLKEANSMKKALSDTSSKTADAVVGEYQDLNTNVSGEITDIKADADTEFQAMKTSLVQSTALLQKEITSSWKIIESNVDTAVGNIKENGTLGFKKFKEKTIDIFLKLKDDMKLALNGIIGLLNKFMTNVVTGINNMVGNLNKLKINIPDPDGGKGQTVKFDVNRVSTGGGIPRLAQGAVIPPNNAFMAVLGDQKRGTNIEAPLDTIKQAVAEELGVQVNAMMEGFAAVVEAINKKQIAIGDKEIGKANARYMSQQNRVRGTSF